MAMFSKAWDAYISQESAEVYQALIDFIDTRVKEEFMGEG